MTPLLQVSDLRVRFEARRGAPVQAVAGLSYELDAGRTLAIIGESGSGKSVSARALMGPPVCMKSNIQSVLFAPDTLDFWVANADSKNVASQTRYTHYNLAGLLNSNR